LIERPRVDVGIVTWNTRDVTVAALRRLLETDQGCELKVYVRDNGSRDGTAEAIARHVPEVDLEQDARNLGFAAGMNRLIRKSTAPWFLLLNPDAWPEPMAIARLVAASRAHPRAAAIGPLLRRPDGSIEPSALPFPSLRTAAADALGVSRVMRRRAEEMLIWPAWSHDRARWVDWIVGAAVLVPREAFDAVGLLDESLFMYAEDLEWCWRARDEGWGVWFEPDAEVVHVGNVSGAQGYGSRRTRAHLHNAYRVYERRCGRVRTRALRGVNLIRVNRSFAAAVLRRDRGATRYWRNEVEGHWRALEAGEEMPRGS
jgi:N-acetylglucosaminyl-diphospho-decaprenol L-rhamnosyltransferase